MYGGFAMSKIPKCQSPEEPFPVRQLWRKLSDKPDNFCSSHFLSVTRVHDLKPIWHSYWDIAVTFSQFTAHLNTILIYVGVYILLINGTFTPNTVVLSVCLGAVIGYLMLLHWNVLELKGSRKTLRATFLFLTWLILLSPILRTCTQDTADETIWAMSSGLFMVNLMAHDYVPSYHIPGALALNAAFLASILLASRLRHDLAVFGLMLFAVEVFALSPLVVRQYPLQLTAVLGVIVLLLFAHISIVVLSFYMVALVITLGLGPVFCYRMQAVKVTARGLWDEARPTLTSRRSFSVAAD